MLQQHGATRRKQCKIWNCTNHQSHFKTSQNHTKSKIEAISESCISQAKTCPNFTTFHRRRHPKQELAELYSMRAQAKVALGDLASWTKRRRFEGKNGRFDPGLPLENVYGCVSTYICMIMYIHVYMCIIYIYKYILYHSVYIM